MRPRLRRGTQSPQPMTPIARLIGGRSDEVALFDNATQAWNAAFYSVPLHSGDQILTGRAEYGSNVLAYWQVASRTGAEVTVVPAGIGRIARACGALFLLDATQSAGQFPVNVDAIGCDLLTGTGRMFRRGPRGTGFLWVRTAALDRLDRSSPRSARRPGTATGASPGPSAPAGSPPWEHS